MQVSIDGLNATGPDDAQKWVTWAWDEIKQYVLALSASCDTELIGRKLAVDYIPFWRETLLQPESMMYEAAQIKAEQKKIVFSRTLRQSVWEDAVLAKGPLADEVAQLKRENGKDLIVYGGSGFVSSLVKERLIDEFHLFVNPVALGNGVSLFDNLDDWQPLRLVQSRTFDSGIVLLHYEKQTEGQKSE